MYVPAFQEIAGDLRAPVAATRSGELKCFINACSHRGARVCRERAGNKKNFTCPFHGWTYSTAGELLDVTDQAQGGYLPTFDKADYGLEEIGRLETYRGFIFGSLSDDVAPLEDCRGRSPHARSAMRRATCRCSGPAHGRNRSGSC